MIQELVLGHLNAPELNSRSSLLNAPDGDTQVRRRLQCI